MMAGARPVPVADHARLPARRGRHRARDQRRARAPSSPCRRTIRPAPSIRKTSLRAVNALCRERGVFHVHDEAYEYFTYDDVPHFSPGSIDGRVGTHDLALLDVEGVRHGELAHRVHGDPESLWDAINKIQDTLLICAPVVSQVAAVAALGVGRAYATSKIAPLARDAADDRQRARRSGGSVHGRARPGRVLFLRPRVRSVSSRSTLTERLIREHRVAVVPGSAFGGDECSIRVSYGALDPSSADEGRTAARPRTSGAGTHVKVLTWNVNGIRARQHEVADVIETEQPDIVCLQEIKASPDKVPGAHGGRERLLVLLARRLRLFGRRASRPSRFFHGTTRRSVIRPLITRSASSSPTSGPLSVASVYVPNGGKDFDAKMRFLEALVGLVRRNAGVRPDVTRVWRPQRRPRGARRSSQGTQTESDRDSSRGEGALECDAVGAGWWMSGGRSIPTTTSSSRGGRPGGTSGSATSAGGSTTCWPAATLAATRDALGFDA